MNTTNAMKTEWRKSHKEFIKRIKDLIKDLDPEIQDEQLCIAGTTFALSILENMSPRVKHVCEKYKNDTSVTSVDVLFDVSVEIATMEKELKMIKGFVVNGK